MEVMSVGYLEPRGKRKQLCSFLSARFAVVEALSLALIVAVEHPAVI